MDFLYYLLKAALLVGCFHALYRLLLHRETFYRVNRIVLIGIMFLSYILPLCVITVHKVQSISIPIGEGIGGQRMIESVAPWWQVLLIGIYWSGVVAIFLYVLYSIGKVKRIIRKGKRYQTGRGYSLIVTEQAVPPFSWMKYIVLSGEDYNADHEMILMHEEAHIRMHHSYDMLLASLFVAFQWFNPASWMVFMDLRSIHEFEADESVVRSGVDLKAYQYLLVRKAYSGDWCPIANSFNHSTLKKRIYMMLKNKSGKRSYLKVLCLLPFVAMSLAINARVVYDVDNAFISERDGSSHGFSIPKDSLKETSAQESFSVGKVNDLNDVLVLVDGKKVNNISEVDPNTIESITILKNEKALAQFGGEGKRGVILVSLKGSKKEESETKIEINSLGASSKSVKTNKMPNGVTEFYVDGKKVSATDFNKLPSATIKNIKVDKTKGINRVEVTTKGE